MVAESQLLGHDPNPSSALARQLSPAADKPSRLCYDLLDPVDLDGQPVERCKGPRRAEYPPIA
jgi:hypothetical protein